MADPSLLDWATFAAAATAASAALGGSLTGFLKFRSETLLPAVETRPIMVVDGAPWDINLAGLASARIAVIVRNRTSSTATVYELGMYLGYRGGHMRLDHLRDLDQEALPPDAVIGPELPLKLGPGEREMWSISPVVFGQLLEDVAGWRLGRVGAPCVEIGPRLLIAKIHKPNFHRWTRSALSNWLARADADSLRTEDEP